MQSDHRTMRERSLLVPACLLLTALVVPAPVHGEAAPEELPLAPIDLPEPLLHGDSGSEADDAAAGVAAAVPDLPAGGLPEPRVETAGAGPRDARIGHELEGYASWYGGKFQGRLTANGEIFDTTELTAAHKTLPFDTIVEVTHTGNGRTVEVRINDRGPFVEGRVIDLSRAAADTLDMAGEGVAPVRLRIVSEPPEAVRSIQVASFSEAGNAHAVVRRLEDRGIPAELEPGETSGGDPITRVVVPNVVESQVPIVVAQLVEAGYPSVLVRSR